MTSQAMWQTQTASPLPSTFFSASTFGIVAVLHDKDFPAFVTYYRPTRSKLSNQVPKKNCYAGRREDQHGDDL